MQIILPTTRDAVVIGGVVFTDITNIIALYCGRVTGGNVTTPTQNFSTNAGTVAGYVVPAGKVLQLRAIRIEAQAGSANGVNVEVGYGDNDKGLNVGAVRPTNAVYHFGAAPPTGAAAITITDYPFFMEIPTGKYPYVKVAVDTGVSIFGVLR